MQKRNRSLLPSAALVLAALGVATAAGCGSVTSQGDDAAANTAANHPQAGRCEAGASALRPVGAPQQSGAIALGKFEEGPLAGKTLAFVADEDAKSVTLVDVDSRKELAQHKLEGTPSQLMILSDGRLLVGIRDKNSVAVFHAATDASLAPGCSIDTAAEPVALAITPDQKTVLVSTGWGQTLESLDAQSLAKKAKVDLPREPRTIVVDDAGKFAYVSHAVGGKISVVDLATMRAQSHLPILINPNQVAQDDVDRPFTLASAVSGAVGTGEKQIPGRFGTRMGCQGFPMTKSTAPKGRILAPQILVDPGDPENRAQGYGDGNSPTEIANVAVIDSGTRKLVSASMGATPDHFFGRDPSQPEQGECILPRAASVDDHSQTLLVTCLGIDAVVAYDAASANPVSVEKARWDVGSGPTGIAIDNAKRRAIVWSQFERSLDVLDLAKVEATVEPAGTSKKHDRIALKPLGDAAMPLAVVLGRQIFHTVGDARVSRDGRACASCHPDGRDDAITWATPEGPRRTIMLAGRLTGTEPFAWNGTSKDLRDHLHHTFERLNGQGLRNVELEALVAYLESLPPPPRQAVENVALVEKGDKIFHSKQTECATCHGSSSGFTDLKTHDLGSKARADRKPAFDTPSLRYVSGRAPYFHDGRFESLRELLVQSDGMMGHTKHLEPEEVDALEAYLKTL